MILVSGLVLTWLSGLRELLEAFINVFRSVGQLKDVCVSEEDRTSSGQVWDGRNGEKPVSAP